MYGGQVLSFYLQQNSQSMFYVFFGLLVTKDVNEGVLAFFSQSCSSMPDPKNRDTKINQADTCTSEHNMDNAFRGTKNTLLCYRP